MESKRSGLPHFSRIGLWMIMVILLPRIINLNQTGEKPEIEDTPMTLSEFSLPERKFNNSGTNARIILPAAANSQFL